MLPPGRVQPSRTAHPIFLGGGEGAWAPEVHGKGSVVGEVAAAGAGVKRAGPKLMSRQRRRHVWRTLWQLLGLPARQRAAAIVRQQSWLLSGPGGGRLLGASMVPTHWNCSRAVGRHGSCARP